MEICLFFFLLPFYLDLFFFCPLGSASAGADGCDEIVQTGSPEWKELISHSSEDWEVQVRELIDLCWWWLASWSADGHLSSHCILWSCHPLMKARVPSWNGRAHPPALGHALSLGQDCRAKGCASHRHCFPCRDTGPEGTTSVSCILSFLVSVWCPMALSELHKMPLPEFPRWLSG